MITGPEIIQYPGTLVWLLPLPYAPLVPGPGVGWEWGCFRANPPIAKLWVPNPDQGPKGWGGRGAAMEQTPT